MKVMTRQALKNNVLPEVRVSDGCREPILQCYVKPPLIEKL